MDFSNASQLTTNLHAPQGITQHLPACPELLKLWLASRSFFLAACLGKHRKILQFINFIFIIFIYVTMIKILWQVIFFKRKKFSQQTQLPRLELIEKVTIHHCFDWCCVNNDYAIENIPNSYTNIFFVLKACRCQSCN